MKKKNFPYTYLRKINADTYEMSVVIQPDAGKSFSDDATGLSKPTEAFRVLKVMEQAGGGALHQQIYPIQSIGSTGKQAHVKVAFGPIPQVVNICKLHFAEYQDGQQIVQDQPYLPHLYLQSHKQKTEYTLFGAVFQAANFQYTKQVVDTGANRKIHILESAQAGNPPGFWEFEDTYPSDVNGTVEVIVFGADDAVTAKGKGKVLHSVADNKPFF